MKTFRKSIILLSLIASGLSAFADTYVEGGFTWYYEVQGGEARIFRAGNQRAVTGSFSGPFTLTVPSSIRGYPVVEIGDYAFSGLTGSGNYRSELVIPSTVRKIGANAFCNARVYTEIPSSVREIGNSAFEGFVSFSGYSAGAITIPEGVKTIGDRAFYNCTALETTEFRERFVIPESVVSIGAYAFAGIRSSALVIGNSVKEIGSYAFANGKMAEVTIGSSVQQIGEGAFSACNELLEIDIPDNVLILGSGVCKECASLRDVKFGSGMGEIPPMAFMSCHGLTNVVIGSSVTNVAKEAFRDCTSLGEIHVPDNVSVVGEYAFSFCSVLSNVVVTSGVIDNYAFYNSGVKSLFVNESVERIGGHAFTECSSLLSAIVAAVDIDNYAFYNCGLKDVQLQKTVERIGAYAFSKSGLAAITIPEGVKVLGESVCRECANLQNLKIRTEVIPANSFASCHGLVDVEIGVNVTNIAGGAFNDCVCLGAINIPGNVQSIKDSAFGGCSSLTNVHVSVGVKDLGGFRSCTKLEVIEVPNTVENIGAYAFYQCMSLKCVELPLQMDSIGDYAFYGCSSLEKIKMPEFMIGTLGEYAFCGCTLLCHIDIPSGIEVLPGYSASSCASLESIYFGEDIKSIHSYVFRHDGELSCISFVGKSPTSIGFDWLYNATKPIVYVTDKWDASTQTWQGLTVKQVHLTVTPADKTTFDKSLTITMSCDCDEATVRYTLDGSKPTCESTAYSSRFRIAEKTRVRAQAFVEQLPVGSPVDVVYGKGIVSTPAFTPAEVTAFTGRKQEVAISVATEGATIHYTTDGSIPTEESAVYGTPLSFTEACVIKAVAVLDGYIDSEVATLVVERKKTADSALNFAGQKINVTQGAWITDAKVSHDGRMSIRSDNHELQSVSVLETVVSNASAVSFWWKASCEYDDWGEFFYDHAEFWIDEELVAELDDVTVWRKVRKTLEPAKSYRLQWKYVKDDYDEPKVDFEDCVWIDELSLDLPMDDAGGRVSTVWLNEYTELLDAADGNYSAAAKLTAANGQPAWKSYVIGIDPTEDVRSLKAFISIGQDGKPVVTWDPDANEGKGTVGVRKYTILGKDALQDKDWADVPEDGMQDYHFFKVKVEVPE